MLEINEDIRIVSLEAAEPPFNARAGGERVPNRPQGFLERI